MQIKKKKTTTVIEEITIVVEADSKVLNLNKEKEIEFAERLLEHFGELQSHPTNEIVTRK